MFERAVAKMKAGDRERVGVEGFNLRMRRVRKIGHNAARMDNEIRRQGGGRSGMSRADDGKRRGWERGTQPNACG